MGLAASSIIYNEEKNSINNAVASLRDGLSNNVIQYTDTSGNVVTTTSGATRRALERQLDQAIERQTTINSRVDNLNQQLFEYETEIVEVQTSSEIGSELGPLKYLAGLTGLGMDKIINYLLLTIIFVFDPLAISLVIAANFAFDQAYPKRKYKNNLYGEKVEDIEVKDAEEFKTSDEFVNYIDDVQRIKEWEAAEERMKVVGQNGNEGTHYNELSAEEEIQKLQNQLQGDISGWRRNKIQDRINKLNIYLSEDDQTKTY